jgi:hypothetical protein
MYRIIKTNTTSSILIGRDVYDEQRDFETRITLFGITLKKITLTHTIDYRQAITDTKSIGFVKSKTNVEKTEKK